MKFDTITDALKWCLDHPNQKLVDKDGREIWFILSDRFQIKFMTNVLENGAIVSEGDFAMFPSDFPRFDIPTLSPKEPEKPTLNNLAALENWDWFKVTFPNGIRRTTARSKTGFNTWTDEHYELQTALSAGWPVEFGRDEA